MLGARALNFPSTGKELAGNRSHAFAAEHALNIYASNAIYTFIPKNACSTMRYSLALANGCIAGEDEIGWIHANNQTFRASLRELVTAEYTFVILRCPFARLASFYLDKIVNVRTARRNYLTVAERSHEEASFEAFVRDLDEKNLLSRNQHWRPQVDFLVYKEYDDYFCVEEFATAERVLRERIGLDVRDARQLIGHDSTAYEKVGTAGEFAATPASEIADLKSAGKIPEMGALFSETAIATAARLFAEDCQLFRERCGRAPAFGPPQLRRGARTR